MSGAGCHKTGWHVSSWGWPVVDVDLEFMGGNPYKIQATWHTWRVTKDNKLIAMLTLPPDIDAGEVLGMVSGLEY